MPPFPSLYKLIVTPVIAILSDLSILESLQPNPGEVDDIFDHPLEARLDLNIVRGDALIRIKAFLDPTIIRNETNLSPPDSEKWPYPEELWVRHIVAAFESAPVGPGTVANVKTPHRAIAIIPS